MTGSEWFESRPGGLNRYFDGLVSGLRGLQDVDLHAQAFGVAPARSASWGPTGMPLPRRVKRAARRVPGVQVVDRHFALYGPRSSREALNVFHFHGPWASESGAAGEGGLMVKAKKSLERSVYRSMDHFIVLSRTFKDVLMESYDVPESKISIIQPGVKVDEFEFLRKPSGKPVALCVRRLERRMGIHVLIDAWKDVKIRVPDAELHIVGTGTYEGELRAQAANVSGVSFLGRLEEDALRAEYANAALTVVPTIALEGFGLITLESLAAGRAPIVTDCGGLPDGVKGLDLSLIVPSGNPQALSARLISAFQGERPTPEECRAHAETFSWENVAKKHISLYNHLLEITGRTV